MNGKAVQPPHGSDANAVAPGVSQDEMDFPRAIEACEAAVAADPDNPRLQWRAAQYGRLAGQIGYARYALDGEFNECEPTVVPNELKGFLATAAASTSNYYQTMLIEMLQKQADEMWPETEGS